MTGLSRRTAATEARKLADLLARVARVRELLPATAEAFLTQRTQTEALILNLYLALQGASDIALHIVAERGLGVPADARSAFEALHRAGVLLPELTRRLAAAVGLRNRIAHEYGSLDLKLVYEAARDDIEDLVHFAAAVAVARGSETT